MKSKLLQTNKKKTRRRVTGGGIPIRIETLLLSSKVDSHGELRETWKTTRKSVSQAVDAITAPDTCSDARVPRNVPP